MNNDRENRREKHQRELMEVRRQRLEKEQRRQAEQFRQSERRRLHRVNDEEEDDASRREFLMRGRTIEVDEEEEPGRHDLLETLRDLEKLRSHLNHKIREFKSMISDDNPELAGLWNKFTLLGLTTADEFEQFMNGKKFRGRLIQKLRHMRLVSSNDGPLQTTRTGRRNDDDDAA
jgi:hypothetical protein